MFMNLRFENWNHHLLNEPVINLWFSGIIASVNFTANEFDAQTI